MVTRPNKVFSSKYFTKELASARYFLEADELCAYWACGDARFGVRAGAAIDALHFERLFEGKDADGNSLLLKKTGLKKRVSAYELSVGVSKSVSAAWALATPSRREDIERAFVKSLEAVTLHVERNSFTRLGVDGKTFVRVQPNIAVFVQPDTRPVMQPDGTIGIQPQLHAHLICVNLIAIQENALTTTEAHHTSLSKSPGVTTPLRYLTRSLDGQPLYHGAKSWGAVQHLAFATELQKLGYRIGEIGKNGTFEVLPPAGESNVDRRLREFWSLRRSQIVETLREVGLTTGQSPALAARAAVATRRSKSATPEDAFARWRSEAIAMGLDVENYTENRLGFVLPTKEFGDIDIATRMAALPARLTESEVTFTNHDLVREIASALVGSGAEASRVEHEAEKLAATGLIVQIGSTDRERIFSTPEMIRLEREVVSIATRLSNKSWRGIDRNELLARCKSAGLSDEQTAAALSVANGHCISFVEGRAGTGKTATLRPICRTLETNSRVIATGVSWRTARMLQSDLTANSRLPVEARALDSWLAISKAGGEFCDSRTILLVDEASQIGVRAMHALLVEIDRSNACAVFLADRAQTIAISAGSGIELVARAVEAAEISKVVRQSDPELRVVVEQLAEGDITSAMLTIAERGCLVEADGPVATVKVAVDSFFAHRAWAPRGSHLLICKSNATRLSLDAEVRRRLRADHILTGEDVTIDAVTASGRAYRLSLAKGDRIRFGVRSNVGECDVINGSTGVVYDVALEADGHALIVAEVEGRSITFSSRETTDDQGRVRLSTDYACTIWASQGLTSQTAIIVADSAFDRRDCYVALSRAKSRSLVCIDSRALNLDLRADSGFERLAEDITPEERREHLVRQMSRWRVKSSTLDFIADPACYSQGNSMSATGRNISDALDRSRTIFESEASL